MLSGEPPHPPQSWRIQVVPDLPWRCYRVRASLPEKHRRRVYLITETTKIYQSVKAANAYVPAASQHAVARSFAGPHQKIGCIYLARAKKIYWTNDHLYNKQPQHLNHWQLKRMSLIFVLQWHLASCWIYEVASEQSILERGVMKAGVMAKCKLFLTRP